MSRLRKEGHVEARVVDDEPLDVPMVPERHQVGPVLDEVGRTPGAAGAQGQEPFGRQAVDADEPAVEGFGRKVEAVEEGEETPRLVEHDG